jgi:hypothetical protein
MSHGNGNAIPKEVHGSLAAAAVNLDCRADMSDSNSIETGWHSCTWSWVAGLAQWGMVDR